MALRVLVVDDDALSREVFSLLLGKAKYEVETAESGDKAVGLLEELPVISLRDACES
jgi:CheY-like chemotaxis protein